MSLTILQSGVSPKKVVLVDLGYPYGKKVYMSGSVVAVAAQLMAVGHEVDIVDFNIDNAGDKRVRSLFYSADYIGVSVMGSPAIPAAIQFSNRMARQYRGAQVLLGGQVISRFSPEQFNKVFGSAVAQISCEDDATSLFGILPSSNIICNKVVWDRMGEERLKQYLSHEFALVLSDGCKHGCLFCSANKNQRETFRDLSVFRSDLLYLLEKADRFGLEKLECYASSLDFFQNPQTVFQYLAAMAEVQEETGVDLATRCLTCMDSFLAASNQLRGFRQLVRRSGLWCLGFGVDGPTEEDWKEQKKIQNRFDDIAQCYDFCKDMGVRAEVLTVMGHPTNSPKRLWQTVRHLGGFVKRWPNTVLRPYVARDIMPGNEGWYKQTAEVEKLLADPQQFFNLDICGLANSTTHPCWWQRWLVNAAYLYIILRYAPFGRCATSPLLPQGESGLYGKIAKLINRYMPFDR